MRITQNTNYDTVRESIRRSKERMDGLQQQAGTLKKLNTPSDNPVGATKVLEIRTDKVLNEQFIANSKNAEMFLNNTEHALSEMTDIIGRAKEIAVGQASGAAANDDSRLGIAEEVTQLFMQAVAAANRKVGDRFIFGGYKTNSPPVDNEGRYQGDEGQMMVEIAKDLFVSINMPGVEAFNSNPKASYDTREMDVRAGREPAGENEDLIAAEAAPPENGENVNVFDELQNLRIALLTGDMDSIRGTLERFDQIYNRLVAVRAKIGSRMAGISSTAQAMERQTITNAQLSSSIEDADMAQVVSDLAKEETVFRSALASSQKLVQPTLLDFLK